MKAHPEVWQAWVPKDVADCRSRLAGETGYAVIQTHCATAIASKPAPTRHRALNRVCTAS